MITGRTPITALIILAAILPVSFITAQDSGQFAAVRREVLLNDLTVIGVPDTAGSFELYIALKHGALFDPPQKQGTAYLTARCVAQQLRERIRLDFSQDRPAAEQPSVQLETWVTADGTFFRLSGPVEHLTFAGRALAEILPAADFDEAVIGPVKTEVIAEIRALERQPCYLAQRRLRQVLMQPSPYAFPPRGTSDSLSVIEAADLIRFYRRCYLPNRTILLISSPLSGKDFRLFATRFFGMWTKQEAPEYNFPKADPAGTPTGLLQQTGDTDGCCIAVGAETLPVKHDDTPALHVLRRILQKRLVEPAGSRNGYVIDTESEGHLKNGVFLINAAGPAAAASEVTSAIHQSVQDLIRGGCSPAEFLGARNDLVEEFLAQRAEAARRNQLLVHAEFYRLGVRYLDDYPDQLDGLIREDIAYLAGKYLAGIKTVIVSRDPIQTEGFPIELQQFSGRDEHR
ncbi:MAG: insulinase family protein [Acidobacteria bacterium]|nr:insulinase family protein [Acidobacteriota bacterium]